MYFNYINFVYQITDDFTHVDSRFSSVTRKKSGNF